MHEPREVWRLDTRRLGRRVLVFDHLPSTNTHAATLADDPANDGVIVLAEAQSSGRGQHGRSWHCPAGEGILLSALLFPAPEVRRPVVLAAWAAVAVCETILTCTGLQAKIKWPNDVLLKGRKVCGILIEQGRGTVAGIGLNVNQSGDSFTQAALPDAASLALFTGAALDRLQVLEVLIRKLDEEYDRLCAGDFATLEACWKWRSGLLGKQVLVECHDGHHTGRLREMSFAGLEIDVGEPAPLRLAPERVAHIGAMTNE